MYIRFFFQKMRQKLSQIEVVCFVFTCIKSEVHVLACAHAIAVIKWRRLHHARGTMNVFLPLTYNATEIAN